MFVNPMDIQQLPPPPPPLSLQTGSSLSTNDEASNSVNPAMLLKEPAPIKSEPFHAEEALKSRDQQARKRSAFKTSPRSSVSNSPAISARSPSISKRSPAATPRPKTFNPVPILAAVAEECLGNAHAAVHDVAMSLEAEQVEDYRKLIVTGLTCLEAAFQNNKLAPREEARLRLRYAAVVQEETEDLMEAETVLSKGIALCEQVCSRSGLSGRGGMEALT